jgi:hypothetical protein
MGNHHPWIPSNYKNVGLDVRMNNDTYEPCVLDNVCDVLGLPCGTRLIEVVDRIRQLQYYYRQLERVEAIACSVNGGKSVRV